jgi:hypothetical protein
MTRHDLTPFYRWAIIAMKVTDPAAVNLRRTLDMAEVYAAVSVTLAFAAMVE